MDTERKLLSFDECIKMGGHCYETSNFVVDTLPETYHRSCKHCGFTQHGWQQPSILWKDDERTNKRLAETNAKLK
jgi:hypothetical protein